MKNTSLYLPFELIIQILLRLPVKSLLCFKCVCKSWFSLISDPHFANSHFDVSTATHTHRIVLLYNYNPLSKTPLPVKLLSIDFETSINHDFNHDSVSLNPNFLLRQPYHHYYEIKGSCRGFIFLRCAENLFVWNASTGFHRQIPLFPFDSKLFADRLSHLYGFGYDQSRDDYLVVLLSCDQYVPNRSSHLAVFSLRDNTWNDIEGPHFTYLNAAGYPNPEVGSVFNGSIHWLASRQHHDLLKVKVIVAFDLMEMKLFEMPLPDDFNHFSMYYGLWVFGEFLSLWAMDHNHTVEIWVMKAYKLHSSWTKTLVTLIDDDNRHFFPIYSTKSGDIIGTNGWCHRNLVKYNDKGQLLEYLQTGQNVDEVGMYTESLLSLPGDLEQSLRRCTNKKNEG